jgi:hypothetical protein
MLATIETLPEAAWEPRSSGEDETSWNAGQIILHLANAQSSLVAGVRQLVDQPAGDTTRYELTTDIAAMDAIGVFHDMTAEARELFASIPEDADLTRTVETDRLGSLGIKGWLLIMAIHEADHLGQLKSLSS